MIGTKVDFNSGGAVLRLDQQVSGVEAEIQNVLVNAGCLRDSDPVHPTRGTNLLKDALSGAVVDVNSAQHSANFAALATLNFVKSTLPDTMKSSPDRLSEITFEVDSFDGTTLLTLSAQVVTADKRVIGTTSEIIV